MARQRNYAEAGRRAFERGEPASKNPYRYGGPHWNWAQGWTDAWWASPAGQAESARLNVMCATPAAEPKGGEQ